MKILGLLAVLFAVSLPLEAGAQQRDYLFLQNDSPAADLDPSGIDGTSDGEAFDGWAPRVGPPASCPTGQEISGNYCVAINCPIGERLSGNECVEITCPTGKRLSGNECVQIVCPGPYYGLQGNVCVITGCPDGFAFYENQCWSCPGPHWVFQGGECVRDCQFGYVLVDNKCVPPITCPTGQKVSGNKCVPITCSYNRQLIGNACVLLPTCSVNYKLSDTSPRRCIPKVGGCPVDHVRHVDKNNVCVLNRCRKPYHTVELIYYRGIFRGSRCIQTQCPAYHSLVEETYATENYCVRTSCPRYYSLRGGRGGECVRTSCRSGYYLSKGRCYRYSRPSSGSGGDGGYDPGGGSSGGSGGGSSGSPGGTPGAPGAGTGTGGSGGNGSW